MNNTTTDYGTLCDYSTGEFVRKATRDEQAASRDAARHDGRRGVIKVDVKSVYVED
jgi:hypothetical protein